MDTRKAKTPAQQASFLSIQYVSNQEKQKWLDLFADDAVLKDPVGPSPLDPEGNGHHGKEAIAAFWDMAIGTGKVDMELVNSHPCGDECANVANIKKWLGDVVITTELVVVYRVNTEGLIVSLSAYWEYALVAEQLEAAFS